MPDDAKGSSGSENKAAEKPFSVSSPQVSLPKGGGAIRGIGEKFAANPVTGTGSLTVPIALSPGRASFGPQLSLSYDSGAGNGPFGLGWNLTLPSISRRTDRGLPQYDDAGESDTFLVSGAEDLVPELGLGADGQWTKNPVERDGYTVWHYRPRIEGLFSRIERWTRQSDGDTYWRSISRENIATFYGSTPESRIFDPTDASKVFTWLISESRDDKGNAIVYRYAAEDSSNIDLAQASEHNRTVAGRTANRYLKRILYGNTLSTLQQPDLSKQSWLFEAVFDYGEGHLAPLAADSLGRELVAASLDEKQPWPARQDPFSRYRAGFEIRSYRLCQRVLMFHHFAEELGAPDYLVRATDFAYLQSPVASFISAVTQSSFLCQSDGTFLKGSLPALEFEYSTAQVQSDVRELDEASLANLPANVDGAQYQWLDLDGEGLQGVLASYDDVWYYKRNLSPLTLEFAGEQPSISAQFETIAEVAKLPGFAQAKTGRHQFLDLAGDGRQDCVVLDRPAAGFFKRTTDADWENFTALESVPNVDWNDPNLRFIDLNGDGHADVLIAEQEVFTWYPSLAETGFDTALRVTQATDEERGPAVVFADGTQTIFLADMTGDGLTDIVCIRNGQACYWPNIGYGRFGARIAMDNAPWFEAQDLFDPRRIRLADIDGSGTADMIYLASDGVRLYFNQAGNGWSGCQPLAAFPRIDNLATVQAMDLMGNGTACLVWMSSLPNDTRRSMRYVDLMGGRKPHLLVSSKNNLGAETHVRYAPSTRFYLADREAGQPWITKLHFPVQVVERVETYDRISRNRFVTRYAYHHGYFDGAEREFRGFGRVDQWDTEEFAALSTSGSFPTGDNVNASSCVPPVLTRTWFHTGAYFQEGRISKQFEREYYREDNAAEDLAGMTDQQLEAMTTPDTVFPTTVRMPDETALPWNLTDDELREAARALKGSILRQEIYGLDGSEAADRPYSVSESNYTIECLQPQAKNRHAVFFTHAREAVNLHYERKLYKVSEGAIADPDAPSIPSAAIAADPRVTHAFTLEADIYGNVLKSVAIGYGRRFDGYDQVLTAEDKQKQKQTLLTYSENKYTNPVLLDDAYRTPLPSESSTYELIHVAPDAIQPQITNLFRFDELRQKCAAASDGNHDLPYENLQAAGATSADPYRRLIERSRSVYRKDDLSAALAFGNLESMAMPFQSYKLAFTSGLLSKVYQRSLPNQPVANLLPDPAAILGVEGGYIDLDGDGNWWIQSGQIFYSPDQGDAAAKELTFAPQHFFSACRYQDPFNQTAGVIYDRYDLLVLDTQDPMGNRVTAGERDGAGNITTRSNDYRVLQPALMMDPNRNRAAVAFDTLGMVVGTAVMGKPEETLGDTLRGFSADLAPQVISAHLANSLVNPQEILQSGSTRLVYDLFAYQRTQNDPQPQPSVVYALVRETHTSDLATGQQTKFQHAFSYSDGFGREIQKKSQAEPGPLIDGGPDAASRWIASGWTIFNNKGKPVRQYEPFFTVTQTFEFANTVGVSPILFYDPAERVIATLHPNHTFEKVVFDPWRQETWDDNDTVTQADPKTDPDVGGFFARLPDSDYMPTWLAQRSGSALGLQEQSAAAKAAVHANTPAVAHADSLGRPVLTVAWNRMIQNGAPLEERYATRINLDIEGNQLSVTDALNRIVMTHDYDLLKNRLHQNKVDAGNRWMLNDPVKKPLRGWNDRGFQTRFAYDALRRPAQSYVQLSGSAEFLAECLLYGESLAAPETLNLRGKAFQHYDEAGVATNASFDFKGNPAANSRQLAIQYQPPIDWSALAALKDPAQIASAGAALLQTEIFTSSSTFDALNRIVTSTAPDGSVSHPVFNEANLLEQMNVNLRGASTATSFVTNIDYNAKGQRTLIEYGNGAQTVYGYDPETFRLIELKTVRTSDKAILLDLSYSYDPVGNITSIGDAAQQTVYFSNQVVAANNDYIYDSIHRLISATGRELIGLLTQPQPTWDDIPRINQPLPTDGQAVRNYVENYSYDAVGNILQVAHQAANGNWTRTYAYDEPNASPTNNRLTSTTVGALKEPYAYDVHGSMTQMLHLPQMTWDFKDQLASTQRQVVNNAPAETTYYVYDSSGQRVRKVTQSGSGTKTKERIYLGSYEVYREYIGGSSVSLERQTLHVMDDKRRVALVETNTTSGAAPILRYQFDNHVGSATLELDASAAIISYEEYYPYGSTSYEAASGSIQVSAKRYRYTGKERDQETGFSFYGARYYVAWLGVWLSCDPISEVDGANLYVFCRNSPISRQELDGRESLSAAELQAAAQVARNLGAAGRLELMSNVSARFGIPEGGYRGNPAKILSRQYLFASGELLGTPGEKPSDVGLSRLFTITAGDTGSRDTAANLSSAASYVPNIAPSLALSTGFRESNALITQSSGSADTFHEGGLDNLFKNKSNLRLPKSVTDKWEITKDYEDDDPTKGFVNKESGMVIFPAKVPRKDLLVAYAAQTRSSFDAFQTFVYSKLGADEGARVIGGLSEDALRVWQSLAFSAPGGRYNSDKRVPIDQNFGVQTAFIDLLRQARDAGTQVDLNDILKKNDDYLDKAVVVQLAKVNAADSAYVDELVRLSKNDLYNPALR